VSDLDRNFRSLCNTEMVDLDSIAPEDDDVEDLRVLLEKHVAHTESGRARYILDNFAEELEKFVRVMPTDYRRVLEHRRAIAERAEQLAEKQV
ncbi:MAG: hypothetical protein AAF656_13220, partial [Planctomycetota bacterium]